MILPSVNAVPDNNELDEKLENFMTEVIKLHDHIILNEQKIYSLENNIMDHDNKIVDNEDRLSNLESNLIEMTIFNQFSTDRYQEVTQYAVTIHPTGNMVAYAEFPCLNSSYTMESMYIRIDDESAWYERKILSNTSYLYVINPFNTITLNASISCD